MVAAAAVAAAAAAAAAAEAAATTAAEVGPSSRFGFYDALNISGH